MAAEECPRRHVRKPSSPGRPLATALFALAGSSSPSRRPARDGSAPVADCLRHPRRRLSAAPLARETRHAALVLRWPVRPGATRCQVPSWSRSGPRRRQGSRAAQSTPRAVAPATADAAAAACEARAGRDEARREISQGGYRRSLIRGLSHSGAIYSRLSRFSQPSHRPGSRRPGYVGKFPRRLAKSHAHSSSRWRQVDSRTPESMLAGASCVSATVAGTGTKSAVFRGPPSRAAFGSSRGWFSPADRPAPAQGEISMTVTTAPATNTRRRRRRPGADSGPDSGRRRSTSAISSSRTTSRTTATTRFLAPATARTQKIWKTLEALFVEERKKGVLDISQIPSSITAHAPGYIDRDNEVIVGLQTDAPLKRAIMPNGGFRMVASALKTYGYEPDPAVVEAFTKYRKTHNDAVFDAYTPDIRKCRSSHVLTGLPDAYGRGRIIGDYRRVALYGVNRLIERKQEEKAALDASHSTDEIIRDREELAEQIRALKELIKMAASYGFDITGPARTAKEAVQWLYFGYLAGVKEQNGAAMSLGRTSTFLDIYFERDLAAGTLDEEQAQEIIDDFVIKLRIVRFLRTPEYDELFAGDPTWVTESIGGMGDDGRSLVTKTSFRLLQTLYNLGPAPEPNLTIWYSPRMPDGFRRFAAKVAIDTQLDPVRERRDDAPRLGRRRRDRLLRVADGRRQADAVLRRTGESRQVPALRDQRRPRRDERRADRAAGRAGDRGRPRLRRRPRALREDDGLARGRVRQCDERHPLHARQVRLRASRNGAARLRAAADDGVRHGRHVRRRRQPVRHQVREGARDPRRDRPRDRLQDRRSVPLLRQQRQSRRSARRVDGQYVHEASCANTRPTGTRCTRSRS